MTDRDEDGLTAALNALRDDAPRPSPDFLARLEADADALLPAPPSATRPAASQGGWRFPVLAGGGFALASAVGATLGFVMPETLNELLLRDADSVYLAEMLPAADPSLILGEDG